jgi:hypothetical protein
MPSARRFMLRTSGFLGLCALACASPRVVESEFATNRPSVVLREATPRPRPEPSPHELVVRYLRCGGVYFEWQGQALLTAPFATNYPLTNLVPPAYRFGPNDGPRFLPLQRVSYDRRAIARVLEGLPLARIGAILVGHSHYDHIGDLPPVAAATPRARIYVNDSGAKILAGEPELRGRVRSVQNERGFEKACATEPCLIRFASIPSEHAPNVRVAGLDLAWQPGEVRRPFSSRLQGHRLTELREGQTLAFVIDFLDPNDPARVAFRVHYQDAASTPPRGYPTDDMLRERGVDLALVTMPGRETLPDGEDAYPVGLLRRTGARHALVIHYEDFFRPVLEPDGTSNGVRLIPTLANGRAADFLSAVTAGVINPDSRYCPASSELEGLCGPAFTLPLPGEWLVVDTRH